MNNNPYWEKNLKPFKRAVRPYTKKEFTKLYQSGMTISEISDHFGIGRKMVQNDMKYFNVKARVAAKRNQSGDKNANWKGDDAKYSAFHRRLYHNQPQKCEECGTSDPKKRYEWASLTGKYQDPLDYKRMCKICHAKYYKM